MNRYFQYDRFGQTLKYKTLHSIGNTTMKWTDEAEAAIKKVPFFVRKKVRARVEKEAAEENKTSITLAEVKATQNRFLSKMDSDIRGYQIETCFGQNGCPNRCVSGDTLLNRLENLFKEQDLLAFLKMTIKGNLKYHHEFRVGIAECPNACSQPQIRDIAIIGASVPMITDKVCSQCRACVNECKEGSIRLESDEEKPEIDYDTCVRCGACINECPTETISCRESGYRVQLGGRLGRHPRLAKELVGLFSEDQVLETVKDCITFYKQNSKNGKRFSQLLDDKTFNSIQKKCQ